jgi:hypothetical protein
VTLGLLSTFAAFGDTYHIVDFTGSINPGNANVKSPFTGTFTQSGPISGHFVYDDQLIPGAGSGFVNVFFSSFPDIATIPSATAFEINMGGGYDLTLADAVSGQAAIQYNNGHFNGFFFAYDFAYGGSNWELAIQGGPIHIYDPSNPAASKVNAHINIGDASLMNEAVYTPPAPPVPSVPEPGSATLAGGACGLLGLGLRYRRRS